MSSRQKMDAIVIAQHLQFSYPEKELFSDVSFCLSNKKQALVGANGSGKSTLAKLLIGALMPQCGTIECLGRVVLCEQLEHFEPGQTVAQALGAHEIIHAQNRLALGEYSPELLEMANRDWALLDTLKAYFKFWHLPESLLYRPLDILSGGERTKVKLIQLSRIDADLLILDEPTNHLDSDAKKLFIQWLHSLDKGVFMITHDRKLLEQVDSIYELSNNKIESYGGNYTLYQAQKNAKEEADKAALKANEQALAQIKKQYQKNKEHLDKSTQIGKQRKQNEIIARGQASKMYYNDCRNQSEKTYKRVSSQAIKKQSRLLAQIDELSQQMPQVEAIDSKVSPVKIPASKRVLSLENLSVGFDRAPLTQPISWVGYGPFRVSIQGPNGIGKTTLLKVVTGALKPLSGQVLVGVDSVRYLSQKTLSLNLKQTIFETLLEHYPDMDHQMAHNQLSRFLFKDKKNSLVKELSGGERMRLKLACTLLSYQPPQLLILDEPTNHMDIQSIDCVEKALRNYQGALIVVSHDDVFLKQLNLDESLHLEMHKTIL